jgi:DNA-binding NarL/FixJ family response regulator
MKRGRPPHRDLLTPRQWEVLRLLREGLTNDQIAQRLGITERGARYHVSEILSKLGVTNREDAAGWQAERLPAILPVLKFFAKSTGLLRLD